MKWLTILFDTYHSQDIITVSIKDKPMTLNGVIQILLLFGVLLALVKPIGGYMARVYAGERTFLDPILKPVEKFLYRISGVNENEDMRWMNYLFATLAFTVVGALITYMLMRIQGITPWNPQHFTGRRVPPDLAFNTATSFATNTNWQSYIPEATLSYFTNMFALAGHNFMSAATGMAIAIAFIRGIVRHNASGLGNFWVDMTRGILYILLPISIIFSLILVWQGVPQNFNPYVHAQTISGQTQTIPQGPVASQEAIKELGTNGGGFFNANSSHPYENPTPLSNFLEILAILLIAAALTYTFGKMAGNTRQGWAIFAAMSILFLCGVFVCYHSEMKGNPNITRLGVMLQASALQPGGNMEGKEVRFGIVNSALFATATTDTSCGAVNSMHDSYTPIGGMVPLLDILSGEVIFGGVGSGLYGMLMYAIIAVFIAGLMVGRTPEYLGKKIEQYEVKMAMLAVLILAANILIFTSIGANLNLSRENEWNRNNVNHQYIGATYKNVENAGPHGFTEILYAYSSATGNNGSAFAGLDANTPYYNFTIGLAMLIGRFFMIIPLLALAGSLVKKRYTPLSLGTFPTDSATFAYLLVGVVVIVGALTFIPALALGPIVEQFHMILGKLI